MKYQILTSEQVRSFSDNLIEIRFVRLIDFNRDGELCLYSISDLSVKEFQKALHEDNEFLYSGSRIFGKNDQPKRVTARVFKVCEGSQDVCWGEYDYNTPQDKQFVNGIAEQVRSHSGVISSYIETIVH